MQLFLLLQYLVGSRAHWDEIREEAGADNPISLLSLSFPARQRLGGEGIPDTADTPSETARERRILRVWRAQLQACLLADPRDDSAILVSTNSKARGPASDRQWVIDVDHFDSLLRDSAPFCEMLSVWSGRPAMHTHLALGRDRRPSVRGPLLRSPCVGPPRHHEGLPDPPPQEATPPAPRPCRPGVSPLPCRTGCLWIRTHPPHPASRLFL